MRGNKSCTALVAVLSIKRMQQQSWLHWRRYMPALGKNVVNKVVHALANNRLFSLVQRDVLK